MFRRLIWLLTFWLKKPLSLWARINLAPSNTREALGLDPARTLGLGPGWGKGL